jgi:hypothetical protein
MGATNDFNCRQVAALSYSACEMGRAVLREKIDPINALVFTHRSHLDELSVSRTSDFPNHLSAALFRDRGFTST